jgi:hypothetical protein
MDSRKRNQKDEEKKEKEEESGRCDKYVEEEDVSYRQGQKKRREVRQ